MFTFSSCVRFLLFFLVVPFFSAYSNGVVIGDFSYKKAFDIELEYVDIDTLHYSGIYHLDPIENENLYHLEAIINWSKDNKYGAIPGSHVPYLNTYVHIVNLDNKANSVVYDMKPHFAYSEDSIHYAKHISIPGSKENNFSLTLYILPPSRYDVAFHKSWTDKFGKDFVPEKGISYTIKGKLFKGD